MYYSTTCPSPVGVITLASDGEKLAGLWLEGQKYYGGAIAGSMTENDDVPVFSAAKQWLNRYFSGEKPLASELPLAPVGSEFRQKVWERDHLRRYRKTDGCDVKQAQHVGAGGGRSGGTQSHFHYHTVPPGCGRKWKPDRVCRRNCHEDEAAGAGRRRYVLPVYSREQRAKWTRWRVHLTTAARGSAL